MKRTIFVVVREDQNEHGYTDTSIEGAFAKRAWAEEAKKDLEDTALDEGHFVCGREQDWDDETVSECDWDVSFSVEKVELEERG